VDANGWVTRLVEKPTSLGNNRVVVGCYYFQHGLDLLAAIEEQMKRGTSLKGEYFLTDAINIMIEHGLKMRTEIVDVWLDTGTIDATLETNRYLLEHGNIPTHHPAGSNVKIIPPVFIHASAEISDSIIGPFASIGAECKLTHARVEDSILEAGVTVRAAALKGSFIGRQAWVQGRSADDPPLTLNIGDNSSVILK
jgi:glucose-1-phosphate thymidylyltransferase